MILGDHILFDITPNITVWNDMKNALNVYLDSLEKIKGFEVSIPLPAHREVSDAGFYGRIAELQAHHVERLECAYNAIAETPNMTAYEIAGKMRWAIRANSWEDFPLIQKWFAVGEALAHLNYLIDDGKIKKELMGRVYRYALT